MMGGFKDDEIHAGICLDQEIFHGNFRAVVNSW